MIQRFTRWIALSMQKIDQSGIVDSIQLVLWLFVLLEIIFK